jgi:ribokinase
MTTTPRKILVVGSANMDMVVATRRFPMPGETVFGGSFGMFPGGKGANQAVSAAKLGGHVTFVGRMGKDLFRENLTASMRRDGVEMKEVIVDPKEPTGTALITVDGSGQNEIVVVSGSNMRLSSADIFRKRALFKHSSILLVQLEVPVQTVARAALLAQKSGTTVILNPAPARPLPKSLLRRIDYLTPNETELGQLTGRSGSSRGSVVRAARELLGEGVRNIVVTLGERGAMLVNRDGVHTFPAVRVKSIDSTAAGDAFNGAFAFALAAGRNPHEAIHFANRVAAFSVTRMGAQSSMPRIRDLRGRFS